jgi:hypothetical protein
MAQGHTPVPTPLPEELALKVWWGPDPALRFILEKGDIAQQRAAIGAAIKGQIDTLQAQIGYLNTVQGLVGRAGQP